VQIQYRVDLLLLWIFGRPSIPNSGHHSHHSNQYLWKRVIV